MSYLVLWLPLNHHHCYIQIFSVMKRFENRKIQEGSLVLKFMLAF